MRIGLAYRSEFSKLNSGVINVSMVVCEVINSMKWCKISEDSIFEIYKFLQITPVVDVSVYSSTIS
jgi:hypothetical protein